MDILLWSLAFAGALAAVIKSADYFTRYAEKLGLLLKVSPFIIGVTIVSIGTSLPELATSIAAVFQGNSEIVIGNVVGSNTANILLVLGITAIVGKHIYIDKEIINVDLPIVLGSVIVLFLTTLDGVFEVTDGIICILMLITYIVYNVRSHRVIPPEEAKKISKIKRETKEEESPIKKKSLTLKYIIFIVLSGTAIAIASHYTIIAVTNLSLLLNIKKEIIAISAVAIGTSLPELVVSVMAAAKGKGEMAIGNIMGSNIFNVLGVMGITSLFGSLTIPPEMISFTIPALLFITILYIFSSMDKEVTQWEGITFLLIYIAFMGKTFGLV